MLVLHRVFVKVFILKSDSRNLRLDNPKSFGYKTTNFRFAIAVTSRGAHGPKPTPRHAANHSASFLR
jgi:hypothetical protein